MYDSMVVLKVIEEDLHKHRLIATACFLIQVKMLEDGYLHLSSISEAY